MEAVSLRRVRLSVSTHEISGAGVQAHPQKFWFVENFGKIPENLGKPLKILAKSLKDREKSLKIRAKMARNVVWLQKMAPNVWRQTQLRPLFGGNTKNRTSWSLWEKICGQKAHKNVSSKFVEIRVKTFAPQ